MRLFSSMRMWGKEKPAFKQKVAAFFKGRRMAYDADFEVFWQHYPRKVGKFAAKKAFEKAMRSHSVTLAELLEGIAAYMKHKPGYADFAHPSSWLNSGRWLDEWDAPTKPAREDWFQECKRIHGGACGLDRYRHMTEMQKARA